MTDKVRTAIANTKLPRLPQQVMQHAAKAAGDLAPPRMVAQIMSQRLCTKLPKKLEEKGLVIEMEEVFREGPYVVLQLQVTKVDTATVASSNSMVSWMMSLTGSGYQKQLEEDYRK